MQVGQGTVGRGGLVLILVCTFATFSRSALTGLAVATLWALLTRRATAALGADRGVGHAGRGGRWCGVVALAPGLLTAALHERAHVATANVNESRIGYYRVELNEWEHYPVTGVGPGNFVYRFYQFAPGAGETLPFPSGRPGHKRGGSLPGHPGRAGGGGPGAVPRLPGLVVGGSQAPVPQWTSEADHLPGGAGRGFHRRVASAPCSSPSSTIRRCGSCPRSERPWLAGPAAGRRRVHKR